MGVVLRVLVSGASVEGVEDKEEEEEEGEALRQAEEEEGGPESS